MKINRHIGRRISGAIAALALAAAIPVAAAPAAAANASGCTSAGSANYHGVPATLMCIEVVGHGDYISYISGRVTSFTGITNSQIRITGFDKHNHQTGQFFSSIHYGTTLEQDYARVFNATITNLHGGRVCASLWLNGKATPGACESIY